MGENGVGHGGTGLDRARNEVERGERGRTGGLDGGVGLGGLDWGSRTWGVGRDRERGRTRRVGLGGSDGAGNEVGLGGSDGGLDGLRWGGQGDGAESAWFTLILRQIFLRLVLIPKEFFLHL